MSRPPRAGFTLVEMLIVIAIIGILTAFLVPTVVTVMDSGRATECANNLHQIGIAIKNLENRKRIPRLVTNGSNLKFEEVMLPELGGSDKNFKCPVNLNDDATQTSFGFHIRLHRWTLEDTSVVLAMDYGDRVINPYVNSSGGDGEARDERFTETGLLRPRHLGLSNVLIGDLHVATMEPEDTLFPAYNVEELTEGQIRELESKLDEGQEVDIENLTAEQTNILDNIFYRRRWVFSRESHLVDDQHVWGGENIPTSAPSWPE